MSKTEHLKVSDCDLPPAEKYPGKKYRQNPTGSSDFATKNEWVENEASKWYEKMKDHPKFDSTPIYKKADCLKNHLRKLNVAISEARKIIVKIEERNVSDSESESDDDGNDKESDTEEMDTEDNVGDVPDDMEVEASQDMFANSEDEDEETMTRVQIEAMIDRVLSKPIADVIAEESSLHDCVLASRRYKTAKNNYINSYIDTELQGMSSQDVLENFTQIPSYITDSDVFKMKLENLPNSKKSEKRILKNVNETLRLLRESGTHEANEQRKVITSALYDARFGFPKLNETRATKTEAKNLKSNLRSGVSQDLKPSKRNSSDYFPDSVKQIADKCWRTNCTVVEPGKHSRPKANIKDGTETIPAIYQTLTDKEAYATFEDMYKQDVSAAMEVECLGLMEKLNKSSDSIQKQKKMEFVQRKKTRFPSMSWFLSQKPKETKARSDHCTGLCRNCEEPQLNFDVLRKFKKSLCYCKTKRCPNWVCSCDLDDNDEVVEGCDCEPCFCNDCLQCQVWSILF